MINTQKLSEELVSAGITTHGNCNSNGVVWDDDNNEIQTRPDVAAIIAAHTGEPTLDDVKKQLADAVQLHLDTKVSERGYGSILAAVTYVGSQVPQWDAEAQTCLAWRDSVWVVVYQIMKDVEQGLRPIPTKDELIAELPELIW